MGLRVLVVAEAAAEALDDRALRALVWRGMVAIADPVRASGQRSVRALAQAGVRVMMITGDHPGTAAHIAAQLGLRTGRVVTGPELDAMSAAELATAVGEVDVWARVTPAHKVRLVSALQAEGRVVAMTGDGANDAPAIRQADVGIALGERATSAARHAAALVVADGRVETLVDALLEGRALWAAVRDAVGMLVGSNLGEIGYMLLGGVVTGRAPLNARQLLLVNLLTDALPALALAMRTPDASDPARLAEAGPEVSLGAALERDIAWRAAVTAGAAGVGWTVGRWTLPPKQADTVGLASLVGSQLGQTLLLSRGSREVQLAGLGSLAALLAVVQVPPLARFFGCAPLGPVGLAQAAAVSAAGTVAAAALPPVAERLGERLSRAWDRRGPLASEAARLVTESRTLRRLFERGRRLRERVGGVEAGEGT
jgi:cation-transporting ATPase I